MRETLLREANVLFTLLRGQTRDGSHKDRLQRFYAPQAEHYDHFRERLLHGRAEMLEALCLEPGQRVVELGCGTAHNLEFMPPAVLVRLERMYAVDLCPALLERARVRCRHMHNVEVVEEDAVRFDPGAPVDRVYFSYALTMMPDWRNALRNAYRMLKPGGLIGVVDFHLPTRAPGTAGLGPRLHDAFWRRWFAHDGVHLDPAHRYYLNGQFDRIEQRCLASRVPYVPRMTVPYYLFVGRK